MDVWDWKVSAAAGGLLWGSWALFVNWEAGIASAAISASTQATISFFSISVLTLMANRVLALPWRSDVGRVLAGGLLPYALLLLAVVTSHLVVSTHDIARTIAPSASIGVVYSMLYAVKNREKFKAKAS